MLDAESAARELTGVDLDRDAALLAADTRARLELALAGLGTQLDRIEAAVARLAPFADLLEQAGSLSPLDLLRALRSGS